MNLAHVLHRSARHFADRPLWLGDGIQISYREGAERVNRIANAMLGLGAEGDRVAIISTNRFEAFEAYLAALTAGMVPTPLSPKLHPDDIAYMLKDSGANFVIASPEYAEVLSGIRKDVPTASHWITFEPATDFTSYSHLVSHHTATRPDVTVDPDSTAWLFYTSGTTGQPKGVMESHRNLLSVIQQLRLNVLRDIDETDVCMHFAPIAHATTTIGLVYLSVGAAQGFPLSQSFKADKVFEAIEKFSVTGAFMAPTMVQILLQSPDLPQAKTSSLKNILVAGGPMYVEVMRKAIEAFGPIFCQNFGQSEAPAQTGMHKSEYDLDDPVKLRRLGSVGREHPGVELRIIDADGRSVPNGEQGEITVRGDVVMPGYWNRPEATAETLRNGWLHTGDVGYLDDQGYLFLTDRVKDMVISGGSNIYPREIEEVLLQHPAVAEVCVFGVPDELWGEAVKAVVVLRQGEPAPDAETLIDFAKDRLASYKKPKTLEFASELPKNAYGKVMKRELRAKYWRGPGRSI